MLRMLLLLVLGVSIYGDALPETKDCWTPVSTCCARTRPKIIKNKDLPVVITKSGEYFLGEDLVYNGSGNAITIQADRVKLCMGTHAIVLTDAAATGIFVQDSSEFLIKSDAIKNINSGNQTGCGIHIRNGHMGEIAHIYTLGHLQGLYVENSSQIWVTQSQFSDAMDAGSLVQDSTDIHFSTCVFADDYNGLVFTGANRDCSVVKSDFPTATFTNLLAQQIDGLIVEGCSFSDNAGDPTKANLVQFGDALPEQACHDVIMQQCTLINRPSHMPLLGNTAPEGLLIAQGSGFLIDSCVIDIDNTNQDPSADLSGIHIGNPDLGSVGVVASNVTIRNCVIQGPATNGLYPDVGTSGVLIEGCVVSGALKDGIFLAGTTASTVQNNTVVNNGTNGIFLGEACVGNVVSNNSVSANGFNPIFSSLPPLGNGIAITADSSNNIVHHNVSFANAVNGINSQGSGDQFYYNSAYANGGGDYVTATDVMIISHPGDPALTAANITP